MKKDIHPNYQQTKAVCACGHVHEVMSTSQDDIKLDICSKCHPFYTGKQKLVDTAGQVEKFKARQAAAQRMSGKEAKSEEAPAEAAA